MSKIYKEILAKIKASFTEAPLSTCGEGTGVRFLFFLFVLASCSSQHHYQQGFQQNSKTGKNLLSNDLLTNDLLNDSALNHALVGVCVYDVEAKKYIHQYNDEKYFVPASNTKLFTCYAAMKYLGDSLVGLRYSYTGRGSNIVIKPTGDPTFLHSDFPKQPVFDFLKSQKDKIFVHGSRFNQDIEPFGQGWAWNDYNESYMPERDAFPIYGNVVRFNWQGDTINVVPHFFYEQAISGLGFNIKFTNKSFRDFDFDSSLLDYHKFYIQRKSDVNFFQPSTYKANTVFAHNTVPFITQTLNDTLITALLEDTLGFKIPHIPWGDFVPAYRYPNIIHSQPTDSLLKITMHRSDNFFAEQTLLMVSNEKLGYMSDEKIIDTLLKTDLKDLPQPPNWVDGSGLSRYDLFTPQDFVAILIKMKNEFGLSRIENILPTGNTGTLAGLYKNLNGKIFAKTGTLGNQVALSGYLTTKKGKLLIFSVLVNNHMNSAGNVRRAVEKFMNQVWETD